MPSTFFFIIATLLLSLNFVRLWNFAISDWLYMVALGLAILETLLIQKRHLVCWWRNRFLWMAGLILFGATISTVNALIWGSALIEMLEQLFSVTIFISLIWIIVRRGKAKTVIFAFIMSGVFTAIIAITDYLTGSGYGPALSGTPNVNFWGRYAGTLGHPNKLGYFLVLTTLLSLGYLLRVRKQRANTLLYISFWTVITAVQVFGIFLSNSMTAYLGLLLGFLAYFLSSKSIRSWKTKVYFKKMILYFFILIVVSILAVILFSFSQPEFLNVVMGNIFQAWERVMTSTAESRIVVFKLAWKRIVQNPLLGVGYDQISTSGTGLSQSLLGYGVHNALLQIWYVGGLFAFIGWVGIYISVGWSALVALRKNIFYFPIIRGLAIAALSILLMDQFQDAIYQREKWLVVGLFMGYVWEQSKTANCLSPQEVKLKSDE